MPKIRTKKIEGDFTTTTIRLSKENFAQLQKIAEQQGVSNSVILERLLECYISEQILE
jgi:predicted transcriptional regulator